MGYIKHTISKLWKTNISLSYEELLIKERRELWERDSFKFFLEKLKLTKKSIIKLIKFKWFWNFEIPNELSENLLSTIKSLKIHEHNIDTILFKYNKWEIDLENWLTYNTNLRIWIRSCLETINALKDISEYWIPWKEIMTFINKKTKQMHYYFDVLKKLSCKIKWEKIEMKIWDDYYVKAKPEYFYYQMSFALNHIIWLLASFLLEFSNIDNIANKIQIKSWLSIGLLFSMGKNLISQNWPKSLYSSILLSLGRTSFENISGINILITQWVKDVIIANTDNLLRLFNGFTYEAINKRGASIINFTARYYQWWTTIRIDDNGKNDKLPVNNFNFHWFACRYIENSGLIRVRDTKEKWARIEIDIPDWDMNVRWI